MLTPTESATQDPAVPQARAAARTLRPAEAAPPAEDLPAQFLAARGRAAEKALMDMETVFAPQEFAAFLKRLGKSDHPMRKAVLKRRSVADILGQRVLQGFRRRIIAPDVTFYSDGAAPEGKALVICFAGLKARLGLPMPVVLQRIAASRFDVLVLRDQDRNRFRTGAGAYAADFPGLIQAIARDFHPEAYARVITFGNSMGGNPAAQYAVLAGAERAVAVGARPVDDPLRLILREPVPTAFDPLCDCLSHRPVSGLWIFGGQAPDDRAGAEELFARAGGQRLEVPKFKGHNVLLLFWERGELGRLVTLMLDSHLPCPRDSRPRPKKLRNRLRTRALRFLQRFLRRQAGRTTEG